MRIFLFPILSAVLLGILSYGCAKKAADADFGHTTEAELKAQMGQPEQVTRTPGRPAAKTYVYSEKKSFQIENETVVAEFREPMGTERRLQYWLHAWKGVKTRYAVVSDNHDVTGKPYKQLVAASLGITVIYDPTTDYIIRVVHYAAR